MNNLRWLTQEELKTKLTKVNQDTNIERSGIPITYDDQNLYINDSECHSLVIGATGSGKTQTVLLPQTRLAIKAGESIVINDIKGEIYDVVSEDLKMQDYNTIILDLENPNKGNCYNPLKLAKDLYRSGNKDKALELIDNIAYYLLSEKPTSDRDPFWENSTINYFTGLALYLFENNRDKEITINDIFDLSTEINFDKNGITKLLSNIDKKSVIYMNLAGTLLAPSETKGSIISVFSQKLKHYVSSERLTKMMSTTDFDITKITDEKTAIFIIHGNQVSASALVPLIINQIYYSVEMYGNKQKRLNILIDDFGRINAIKDIINVVNFSRSLNIRFTIFVMSLLELKNTYGSEITELIKISFGNIIYLLANDIETLDEISNMCGKNNNVLLITPEELKQLEVFEAVVLMPRVLPIRTKLVPDYTVEWYK